MTDNKTKIEYLKDFFNLHYYLGFKKSDVIAGILKKYMLMSVKIYSDKKEEFIKLIDKNEAIFLKYKNKSDLPAEAVKQLKIK
jgi:hypothetical protein